MGFIIGLLLYFDIDYETYNKGVSIISFFLGPATGVLTVAFYRQIDSLKNSGISILIGIIAGCITRVVSIFYINKLFGLTDSIEIIINP